MLNMYDFTLTVNLQRPKLLTKLQENRERYVKSFSALMAAWKEISEKYRKDYQEWEAKYVAETLGKDEKKPQPPKNIEDRTDEYDLYISMFEEDTRDHVELNKENYDQLWRDNWRWMSSHKDSIGAYRASDMVFSGITSNSISAAALSYGIL